MYKLLITKDGRRFEDPPKEVEGLISFGIVWDNTQGQENKILSPFSWNIVYDVARRYSLRDLCGEVRLIEWGKYYSAIECHDWSTYDKAQTEVALEKTKKDNRALQEQIDELLREKAGLELQFQGCRNVLSTIYDINEAGGSGSRAKVRNLLFENGIVPCERCGHAGVNCAC